MAKKPKDDDSPRFKLLDCKLCGVPFEEHGKPMGGLVSRKLDDVSISLTDDLRIIWTDKCIAAIWIDFNTKRIFPGDKND